MKTNIKKSKSFLKQFYIGLAVLFSAFAISNFVLPAQTALAADDGQVSYGSCESVEGCDFTEKFINPTIKLLTAGVGIVVTAMIIIAGIQYSSAQSDPQKVAAAKSKITNAIIALITYIFFFGLMQWLWPGGIV